MTDKFLYGLAIVLAAATAYFMLPRGEKPTASPGSVEALFAPSLVKVKPSTED
jgi:hypothetical protein